MNDIIWIVLVLIGGLMMVYGQMNGREPMWSSVWILYMVVLLLMIANYGRES